MKIVIFAVALVSLYFVYAADKKTKCQEDFDKNKDDPIYVPSCDETTHLYTVKQCYTNGTCCCVDPKTGDETGNKDCLMSSS